MKNSSYGTRKWSQFFLTGSSGDTPATRRMSCLYIFFFLISMDFNLFVAGLLKGPVPQRVLRARTRAQASQA